MASNWPYVSTGSVIGLAPNSPIPKPVIPMLLAYLRITRLKWVLPTVDVKRYVDSAKYQIYLFFCWISPTIRNIFLIYIMCSIVSWLHTFTNYLFYGSQWFSPIILATCFHISVTHWYAFLWNVCNLLILKCLCCYILHFYQAPVVIHDSLLNRLFRRRSKKTSMLRVTGLRVGNSLGTGEFPAQMASYAENVSIWWRHHATTLVTMGRWC